MTVLMISTLTMGAFAEDFAVAKDILPNSEDLVAADSIGSVDSSDSQSQEAEVEVSTPAQQPPQVGNGDAFQIGSGIGDARASTYVLSNYPDAQVMGNIEVSGLDMRGNETPSNATRDANIPPVAALQYVILNPETLNNRMISTETMIAWLWSNNGVDFTYDPDGNGIAGMWLGGIPESAVIGYLEGNIGFVTQITTPGYYEMFFYVVDGLGAQSNVVWVGLEVTTPPVTPKYTFANIDWGTTKLGADNSLTYYDFAKSIRLSDQYNNDAGYAEQVFQECIIGGSPPSGVPNDSYGSDIVLSGKLIDANTKKPVPNTNLNVYMPLTAEKSVNRTLTTDANGEFSLNIRGFRDVIYGESHSIKWTGDIMGLQCPYAVKTSNIYGSLLLYPTTITLTSYNNASDSKNVAVYVGQWNGVVRLGREWARSSNEPWQHYAAFL